MKSQKLSIFLIVFVILCVVIVGIFQVGNTIKRSMTKPVTFTSSKSNMFDCSASISLSNGETFDLDISNKISSCTHLFGPEISLDGKFAAFTLDSKEENLQNNQIIVFFVDRKDWVTVYEYGAASPTDVSFDRENTLSLTLSNGGIRENKQIAIPVIEANFHNVDPVTKKLQFSETFPLDSVLR